MSTPPRPYTVRIQWPKGGASVRTFETIRQAERCAARAHAAGGKTSIYRQASIPGWRESSSEASRS